MKKIISLFATIAMMFSMTVCVSAAESKATVTTTATAIDATEYNQLSNKTLTDGYDAYKVVVSLSDFGALTAEENDDGYFEGRRLTNLTYAIDFNNDAFDIIKKNRTLVANSDIDTTLANKGWVTDDNGTDTSKYQVVFGGNYDSAYPKTDATITSIPNAYTFVVAVAQGKSVTATIEAYGMISSFTGKVNSDEPMFINDTVTINPAKITLGAAPEEPEVPATEVNVTGDAATGYDVSGKDADAAIAGQKVLFNTTTAKLVANDVLKNTSRFIVKYVVEGVVQKEKNYNIYEAAKAEGEGDFTVTKSIAVGIAYDASKWNPANFEFSIVK